MATTDQGKTKRKPGRKKPGPKPGAKAAKAASGAPAADPPKPAAPGKVNGDQSIKFKFELNDSVTVNASGSVGTVRGRVEHVNTRLPRYEVSYADSTGRSHDHWFDEDQLQGGPKLLLRRASDQE